MGTAYRLKFVNRHCNPARESFCCGLRGERVLWIWWIKDFLPKSMQSFSLLFSRVCILNFFSSSLYNISAYFETIIRASFLNSFEPGALLSRQSKIPYKGCIFQNWANKICKYSEEHIWRGSMFRHKLEHPQASTTHFTRLAAFASHFKSLVIITPKSFILLTLRESEIVGWKLG